MPRKYVVSLAVGFLFVVGLNVFLIQRDKELFNKHTPKEHYCAQQAQWHPDCNVE